VGDGRRSDGLSAPGFAPGPSRRLAHPGGSAPLGDLPILGGAVLVPAIAEGRACALGQQASPPGGRAQEWHQSDPDPDQEQQEGAAAKAASSDSTSS
jgi:hypothetical protein